MVLELNSAYANIMLSQIKAVFGYNLAGIIIIILIILLILLLMTEMLIYPLTGSADRNSIDYTCFCGLLMRLCTAGVNMLKPVFLGTIEIRM